MSARALFLDVGPGESRGVVTSGDQPERLLIARRGDAQVQALGAIAVGRVTAVDRAAELAFVDLGEGPPGVVNLTRETGRLVEGAAIEVQVRAEARSGKGANLRWLGPSQGRPRLVQAPQPLEDQLRAFAPDAVMQTGAAARAVADAAQDEVMTQGFALRGGGRIWVEPTRALTAIDVDLGGAGPSPAKKATRVANLEALAEAARVLRLKGLGGLVVFDLVGRGHDGPAMVAAARTAFAPDNPGVAVGQVSRFGTLELTVPRRARPALDILMDETGRLSPRTLGFCLLRALEREALADRGARLEGVGAPAVVASAREDLADLHARLGARIALRAEPGRPVQSFQVVRP
jgi:Ribonuclease G/E